MSDLFSSCTEDNQEVRRAGGRTEEGKEEKKQGWDSGRTGEEGRNEKGKGRKKERDGKGGKTPHM